MQQNNRKDICHKCGLPMDKHVCETLKPAWEKMLYVTDYQKPLNQLVQRLKFSREYYLAGSLARLLLLKWFDAYQSGLLTKPDRIISVPLHPLRFWWRGFNQSELIAKPIARWLNCEYSHNTLIRQRYTPHQSNLDAKARERNLKNAFRVKGNITGQHIVLIDDVITTGSTVQEISELLLESGAATIQVWAVCRTL